MELMGSIDDFEVAVFLTETSTRHSILRKEKTAKVEKERLGTTNGRLTGTMEEPVEVGEGAPGLIGAESGDNEDVQLADIPATEVDDDNEGARLPKEESGEQLFVSDGSEDDGPQISRAKRKGTDTVLAEEVDGEDDKKKLALNTTYDGFSIYGRILCLVVKRRGTRKWKELAGGAGQAMMEEWIASTQVGEGQMMDE